jgi:hypothetical protein
LNSRGYLRERDNAVWISEFRNRSNKMTNGDLASVLQAVEALSPQQQQELYQHLAEKLSSTSASESAFKQRMLDNGLLSTIKPPITDLKPYENRKLVNVAGKPLSETVIEERR